MEPSPDVLLCFVLNVVRPRTSKCKAFSIGTFTTYRILEGNVGLKKSNLFWKAFFNPFQPLMSDEAFFFNTFT